MPERIRELGRVHSAVEFLTSIEGQDRSLIIEMSQAMLTDLIALGELEPMVRYVARYCDALDDPEDAVRIAEAIDA